MMLTLSSEPLMIVSTTSTIFFARHGRTAFFLKTSIDLVLPALKLSVTRLMSSGSTWPAMLY